MQITLPTALTLMRIALIPVFGLCFLLPAPWTNILTVAVFALAAITDWLDGYLARRLEQSSEFGAFLDPVADKLMVAVALVALVALYPGLWMAIPAAVIIGREIAVSALREWMAELGKRASVAVSQLGKVKTAAQMAAIMMLLYGEPIAGVPIPEFGVVLIWLAAILTLYSAFAYLRAAIKVLDS
ncbi:CDP-diacylglycerol--glycerol-3-phosphate 3-phosphatidyltransferase [Halorhodospira halochloris]|uniref:CDP-diacylglycerol--glycerol-3-phosphate 3-phosphatidyltransferase n=1 Tax=Halorhodospira halochloris TaxID=1052 RepID=A0A0X8XA47_HALHR|nr:CDP-diacylglycerol--glycerol-3-phosphate 3-phosphatidyltransferase [Halorhodospira halochloris]MBK1652000.1 CDP-diacylglycerol--glycerol-3-phosphate 3-phosphatidyltransferase [Halorhodospira halochloris]MCG5530884.1 CDP-diacylglycerol--glycerol-3-phosphate 3-phosphatidyltransferase [Halorhodospira halochloris]MCG5547902.1 CDP-diacylglycerol--glycerol-3-phosphate 3-phosphatidyltransferase [Halorhodospira halochloris]BAU58297.1 CDP-diacylglycerol--glycerol-3-phosphate 3-phosphatidyltransferase